MNLEIQKKWVAALRSGEYTQAKGVLKNTDGGMCCLGVLCDIYAKETKSGKWDSSQIKDYSVTTNTDREVVTGERFAIVTCSGEETFGIDSFRFPPNEVRVWAGKWIDTTDWSELASKNDRGATFAQIADIIEGQA